MRHSERLERIPPYLFAQLERKIAEKRAAGIDVITLAIGDPDLPTFPPIVEAAQRAVADPSTHTYPSNRGREEFREAITGFYSRRLAQAYPIYHRDYQSHLDMLDEWVDRIDGLVTFGRQGLFAHDNTHHALAMAYALDGCIREDASLDRERWAA